MNTTKPIFAFAASLLLLASCGQTPSDPTDSSGQDSLASSTSSLASSIDSTSESTRPSSTESEPSSTEPSSSPDEELSEHSIVVHAVEGSAGLTVSAPTSVMAGELVTLNVSLETSKHFVEFIRLYAPTSTEGGVRVNEDAEGRYSFTMPNVDLHIYYKGVLGYTVSFESDHATAELAEDSASYDLFGKDYPVYVMKTAVDDGYAFSGFTVKDAQGNEIATWNDRVDQVGFRMPASDVTVTAHAVAIDEALLEVAGTYSGGVQIDMNTLSSDYELQIDLDGRLTFKTDWSDPYWTGIATFDGQVLEADVTHLSGDGYYTSDVRHLKATFTADKKFLVAEFSTIAGNSITYRYVFGKASEHLIGKKVYHSDFENGNYAVADRVCALSAASGDFFTYVDKNRENAFYFLHAFEVGSETECFSFLAGKSYVLKDEAGNPKVTLSYDGSLLQDIKTEGPEAGTYSMSGAVDLVLDGFGHYERGSESGTYVLSGTEVTLSASGMVFVIDIESHTYAPKEEGGSSSEPEAAYPFAGKTYGTSTTNPIKFYDEEAYSYTPYQLRITFSETAGVISALDLVRLEEQWTPIGNEYHATSGLTYTYNEDTMDIVAKFGTAAKYQSVRLAYNATKDQITYAGTLWNCDQGEYRANAENQILTVVA